MTGKNAGSALWVVFTRVGHVQSIFLGLEVGLLIVCAGAFAHRFSLEMDLVGVVQEPVEDRVGERGIADVVVPEFERELAGDESGATADAVVEQFEQVVAFARTEGSDGEVVDHHEIDLGDGGETFAEAAVGVTQAELLEQPRGAQIERGQALAAGLVGEGTAEEGLAAAGGAVNDEILCRSGSNRNC